MTSTAASDLPIDLLLVILGYLTTVVDLVRFGLVCRSWRSAASKFRESRRDDVNHLKPMFPWLLLSSDPNNPQSRYLYSISESRTFRLHLPQITGHHIVGSSSGFLITADNNTADLHALNPLTGSHIPLPPASTLPCVTRVIRNSLGQITSYKMFDRVKPVDVGTMCVCYYQKAVVSPFSRAVAVIYTRWGLLAFSRPGDTSWTAIKLATDFLTSCGLYDVIFHKDKLCAIDFHGRLMSFDLDHPSNPPILLLTSRFEHWNNHTTIYLVESPLDGDDLFLISRHFQYRNNMEVRTQRFYVYKLNIGKSGYKWIMVNQGTSVGVEDLLFFLGFNGSMAFSSRDLSYHRSNLVFYTDDYYTSIAPSFSHNNGKYLSGDNGMFDLGSKERISLNLNHELRRLNWPPPMWFSPLPL